MKEYNRKNIPLARELRKNMTPWERRLWYEPLQQREDALRTQALEGMGLQVIRVSN